MIELYTAATPNGWMDAIRARPAVGRGRAVPERLELGNNAEEFIKGAQKMLA
jgi:hypothetical protein